MVRYLFILLLFCGVSFTTQGADLVLWDSVWQQMEKLENAGKRKEIIKRCLTLERAAAQEENWVQVFRIVLLRSRMEAAEYPEERGSSLRVLSNFVAQIPLPIRPFLSCALAHHYWEFYLEHEKEFSQRLFPRPKQDEQQDALQWSLPRFVTEVDRLFIMALATGKWLKTVPISSYSEILNPGNLPEEERPTWYDFVAHEYIEFCSWNDRDVFAWSENPYELASEGFAFEPVEKFVVLVPPEKDTDSHLLRALQLFRQLLLFHEKDKDPTAYAAADLDRLVFCSKHAVGDQVQERFAGALDQWMSKWRKLPISARGAAIRAKLSVRQGKVGIAHMIAERGMVGFPETEIGVRQCRALIDQLEHPDFSITTESLWGNPLPDITVKYRNLRELHFRLIPILPTEITALYTQKCSKEEYKICMKQYEKRRGVRSWITQLPRCRDFHEGTYSFRASGKIDSGCYLLLASNRKDFDEQKGQVFSAQIDVTDLSATLYLMDGKLVKGYVQNAFTGEGISGASVQLWIPQEGGKLSCRKIVHTGDDGLFTIRTSFPEAYLCILEGKEKLWVHDLIHFKTADGKKKELSHSIQKKSSPVPVLLDPEIQVFFDSPIPEARLNSLIGLPGKVVSREGKSIAGAKIRWEIFRRTRFSHPEAVRDPSRYPHVNELIKLADGIGECDSKGKFLVAFQSKSDPSVPLKVEPICDWLIRMKVIAPDLKSEVVEHWLTIGSSVWKAEFSSQRWQFSDQPFIFRLQVKDLQNRPVRTRGTLRVLEVKCPFLPQQPSLPEVNASEEIGQSMNAWRDGNQIAKDWIRIGTNGCAVGSVPLKAGVYRLIFEGKDPHGVIFTARETILIPLKKSSNFLCKLPNLFLPSADAYTAGKKLQFFWGTGYPAGHVRFEVWEGKKNILCQSNPDHSTQHLFTFPITSSLEKDGIVSAVFVRKSRCFNWVRPIRKTDGEKKSRLDILFTNQKINELDLPKLSDEISDQGSLQTSKTLIGTRSFSEMMRQHAREKKIADNNELVVCLSLF